MIFLKQKRSFLVAPSCSSQSGFSLIEAVIAFAIMGVIGISLITVLQGVARSQLQALAKAGYSSALEDVRKVLQADGGCASALQAFGILKAQSVLSANIKLPTTTVKEGVELFEYGKIIVNYFKIENIRNEGTMFSADLMMGAKSSGDDFLFKPIKAAHLLLSTDPVTGGLICATKSAELTCLAMGGKFNAAATPACQLTYGLRLCAYSNNYKTGGIGGKQGSFPGTCCNPNEKSNCVPTGATWNSSGLPGNVTQHSVSFICQCSAGGII